MRSRVTVLFIASFTASLALLCAPGVSSEANAFCGFYVGGADAKLYNNATMTVMMRDGTRTVLSMENNYQDPPENFAMVVPVPVVLQKENVRTLPAEVFNRVDQLAAPRLVEYWEIDPCAPEERYLEMSAQPSVDMSSAENEEDGGYGVKIEAQFKVGEYEVVVLSASDSTGLDRWLRDNKYQIPQGAQPLLQPYVAAGMKFFVAKVDIKKVKFEGGMAKLSPLRFHYDTEQFSLPVRLGMINSAGTQDLIVHILSPGKRFEVANYPNVTIPTNISVANETRNAFPTFYASLFDATAEKHPGAVVTEYSWDAATCDPCPVPPLGPEDLATLGGDVISSGSSFVLTRLHARYGKGGLAEDLIFREAKPIVGGREMHSDPGKLERGATESSYNNFQGRYIIRHEWEGAITCENPVRGRWGGPPEGGDDPKLTVAQDVAFAPRDASLGTFAREDISEIDFKVSDADKNVKLIPPPVQNKKSGCAGCATGGTFGGVGGGLALFGVLLLGLRRRRTS